MEFFEMNLSADLLADLYGTFKNKGKYDGLPTGAITATGKKKPCKGTECTGGRNGGFEPSQRPKF